jgi:hypothetical protein
MHTNLVYPQTCVSFASKRLMPNDYLTMQQLTCLGRTRRHKVSKPGDKQQLSQPASSLSYSLKFGIYSRHHAIFCYHAHR